MIEEGDYVLLKGKLCRASGVVDVGKVIPASELVGKEFGDKAGGVSIGKPRLADFRSRFRRGPQIVTEKDIGLVLSKTGLGRDDVVVEGGAGSGFLAASLARVASHVHSYDVDRSCVRMAERNVEIAGLDNVTFHNSDLYEGAEKADVYVLDLPEPWRVPLENLRAGGFLVCYLPTIDQVQTLVKKSPLRFKVFELVERQWQAEEGRFRPHSSGLLHTGFLCFARKR